MASESAELRSAGRHACQCRAGLFVVVVVCVSMSLCIADSAAMLVEGKTDEIHVLCYCPFPLIIHVPVWALSLCVW